MSPDQLFKICNSVAPFGWLLMIIAPKWKWTNTIVVSGILPLLLGLVYVTLIVLFFGEGEGDFNSLQGVMKLFTSPWGVTAAWIHYLAFDMFIGSWELSNGQKHEMSHFLIVPCLLLTFFFGPIGLILFYLLRASKTKKLIHDNF
jgi:Domain of unknown function (DUF4281)